jgi:hypothetical protein
MHACARGATCDVHACLIEQAGINRPEISLFLRAPLFFTCARATFFVFHLLALACTVRMYLIETASQLAIFSPARGLHSMHLRTYYVRAPFTLCRFQHPGK